MLSQQNCFIITVGSHWDTLNLRPLDVIIKIYFQSGFVHGVMDLTTTQNHYIHYIMLLITCGAYLYCLFTILIVFYLILQPE